MFRLIIGIILFIIAIFFFAPDAKSQTINRNCGDATAISKGLEEKYFEKVIWQGLDENSNLVALHMSEGGDSWTMTLTFPTGVMCLLGSGTNGFIEEIETKRDTY